jgi:FkbM family methyltransferase
VTDDAPAAPLTACTVTTVAQLPATRVLIQSFIEHHPGARCHVLLVDTDDQLPDLGMDLGSAEFLHPAEIGIADADLDRLRTAYPAEELCAVLRPTLILWLLGSTRTTGPVLYLDPSVLVLAPIDDLVLAGLVQRSLVLVPRVLSALPEDGLLPDAASLRAAGLFDPGLVAVNRGAEQFLRSWAEHSQHDPRAAGAFLDGAAVLAEPHLLRDPGVGLSVWNAGGRTLAAGDEGALTVDGMPLRTVHFAGFDPGRPWLLSAEIAERPRVLLSEHRLLARLCARYLSELSSAARSAAPPTVDQRIGTARLPVALRVEYRAAWLAAIRAGAQPPAPWRGEEFLAWATAPVDGQPGSTRWAAALWRDDTPLGAELRRRFPDPFGADAAGLRDWCAGVGVDAGALPADAVPHPPDDDVRLLDQLGVSVLGDGEVAELLRAAAAVSGLPVSDQVGYPVVLCCDDAMPSPGLADRRYLVAVPADSGEPAGGRDQRVDETWTLSRSTAAQLDGVTGTPVHPIVLPVRDPGERDAAARDAARAEVSWPKPADAFVFAALADHAHERADNALGAVSAFVAAFPDRADVRLLLVVDGGSDYPEAAERLRLATATDDRIRLVERPDSDLRERWLATADCVVSLHRADHHGGDRTALRLAEPAASGIPVIAVDLGAVGELFAMRGAALVPVGASGVEPNPVAAVKILRMLAEDPEGAAGLGQAVRAELLREHSLGVAGEALRDRVERAYQAWRARRAVSRPEQPVDPLRPLRSARHVLLREPDVGVGHKIPMAPALRKAVLRVLAHYDAHVRNTLGTLIDGVERTAEELARRQDSIDLAGGPADVDLLRDRLDWLTERVAGADERLVGVDDGVLRARAELAGQSRRLGEVEDTVVAEAAKRGAQVDTVADRLDRLTEALDRTLDRIDDLESRTVASLRDRDARVEAALRAAGQAQRTSDALRRVVLREHERRAEQIGAEQTRTEQITESGAAGEPPDSALVLSDAGLLRLPTEDGVMLPLLSSNGTWEPELCALIDSLVEPGAVFLDVGAYVGYHTLRVLSRLGNSGAVIAVEPSTTAVDLLRHNVSINVSAAAAARLTTITAAGWDTNAMLRTEPAMTGGVVVRPGPAEPTAPDGPDMDPAIAAASVPAVRLDRELEGMASLEGMRLSVVKVDAPGCGHRALGGLVRLLRRDRPHVLCSFSATQTSEIGDDPVSVLREFDTWGYDVVLLGETEPASVSAVLDVAARQHNTTLWLRPRSRTSIAADRPVSEKSGVDQPI